MGIGSAAFRAMRAAKAGPMPKEPLREEALSTGFLLGAISSVVPTEAERSEAQWRDLLSTICG